MSQNFSLTPKGETGWIPAWTTVLYPSALQGRAACKHMIQFSLHAEIHALSDFLQPGRFS